jgi:hypothetical protein
MFCLIGDQGEVPLVIMGSTNNAGICRLRWLTFLDRSFCSFNVPLRLESSIGATRKSRLNDAAATEETIGKVASAGGLFPGLSYVTESSA